MKLWYIHINQLSGDIEPNPAPKLICFYDVLKIITTSFILIIFLKQFLAFLDDLKTPLEARNYNAKDVLKTSSRHVLTTFSRRLEDPKMFAVNLLERVIKL